MRHSNSWYALRNGKFLRLTHTQDQLAELAPVVEDMLIAHEELACAVKASMLLREEARRLIIRARRQRLGLGLIVNDQTTAD